MTDNQQPQDPMPKDTEPTEQPQEERQHFHRTVEFDRDAGVTREQLAHWFGKRADLRRPREGR